MHRNPTGFEWLAENFNLKTENWSYFSPNPARPRPRKPETGNRPFPLYKQSPNRDQPNPIGMRKCLLQRTPMHRNPTGFEWLAENFNLKTENWSYLPPNPARP